MRQTYPTNWTEKIISLWNKQLDKISCGVPTAVRADYNTITTNYRIEVSFNEKYLNVSNLLSFF